ncbi:MAG: transcriptional repressor [Clostridia bacterium]|nr:transcriptional repressor [Clostridia bacterium]
MKEGKEMKGYQTEQKKLLLTYLSSHADRAFTLEELGAVMTECGVGKSTVYRLVARLAEEGAVRRYAREQGRGYTYQYHEAQACHSHLHLRCTACGRVIHLSEEISRHFAQILHTENNFYLDDSRTLLFGRCEACYLAGRE